MQLKTNTHSVDFFRPTDFCLRVPTKYGGVMNTTDFLYFRELLTDNLRNIESVTGLAFVGSAAEYARADEWSDHDFFVFTTDGNAEALRQNLTWLPNHDEIALFVRETEHGLKVVYLNGHVLEFAIFEDDWELAGVNSYEVTLDKTHIEKRMADAQVRSIPKSIDVEREFSLLLAHLLIGTGRFRRGEMLSARQFINNFCLNSVVRLATQLCPAAPNSDTSVDNQNQFRRFEIRYPKLAQELEVIQRMDLENASVALLELVSKNFAEKLGQKYLDQISVIKTRLGY